MRLPGDDNPYVVERADDNDRGTLRVRAIAGGALREVQQKSVRSGFRKGMSVQDIPRTHVRKTLGEGTVVTTRELAGREQVLVELHDIAQRVWMPFETLRLVWDVATTFVHRSVQTSDAERFRLRTLAHALTHWNANTGALARLDIDPLPHQIKLVHDILASGNLNWLIADDVGLGKTIEVGMLLHALIARSRQELRVLVVAPAGLTRQWKDELVGRFGLADFRIYGDDFKVQGGTDWRHYPRAIASLDRLKAGAHLAAIRESGTWDVIVFDEGHRLTRSLEGRSYRSSERFKLASTLRTQTDSLMLLSATPHQGKVDRFEALLELLRPDWRSLIADLEANPEVIREVVYRNRKSQVTDSDGNFVFRGQTTQAISVDAQPAERDLDVKLRTYLQQGYGVADKSTAQGRAIGFVMTAYRKLAASSPAALRASLARRRDKLAARAPRPLAPRATVDWDEDGDPVVADERFAGEADEDALEQIDSGDSFFADELQLLNEVIEKADVAIQFDSKRAFLLGHFIPETLVAEQRLIIFTEFRGTLADVYGALAQVHGEAAVVAIHGTMTLDERGAAVEAFTRGDARFLVSTEAGGEGLNLHQRCHTVMNYDLPWNPMRLVQRIGRVYRYGQKEKVEAYNLCVLDTIDSDIVTTMYGRIDQVVDDLAGLGPEFSDRLKFEIFGDLVALADLRRVVAEGRGRTTRRTAEEVDSALAKAREAKQHQDVLLSSARGYAEGEFRAELQLEPKHLESFIVGATQALGGSVTRDSKVLGVELGEDLSTQLKLPGGRLRATLDRARVRGGIRHLSLDEPWVKRILEIVKRAQFGGHHAALDGLDGQALMVVRLRWQNEQGKLQHEELLIGTRDSEGELDRDPRRIGQWLAAEAQPGAARLDLPARQKLVQWAQAEADEELVKRCNQDLHPMQVTLLGLAELPG